MTREAVIARPAISQMSARVSFAAAAAFLALLAALHVLKAELDPSWRVISEYAIGEHGWIMVLAFLSLAVSNVALFAALRSQVRTVSGRIGLALLLTSTVGVIIAAIFTTDPITVSEDARTTAGALHNLGGTLGIAGPIAVALLGWNLVRNPAWVSARRPILWATALVWVSLLVFYVGLGAMLSQNNGEFGPDVLIGWLNRLDVLAGCGWLLTVAWHAIHHGCRWTS